MTETAAEKKTREAKEAAALKAKEEKAAEAAKSKKEEKDALAAEKEAEKNDEKPSKDNLISTVHDEVVDKLLQQGSSKKAKEAEESNYLAQQKAQAALELETQHGLSSAQYKKNKDDK